ncbi:hypothetical protein [Engelhardtia mirabilis]|uniref:Uncharacterized protein n=1 Tax=Engelhardtia mirabilis TaxID=2528011 RepID=A0A518BIG0_9BACT|nr:hypothetical protein Pla133_18370 [Planctomycetes bacterium Pla133]QDV01087.1 hypothetical protein Pla86_18360 [Planctomycetes bacterium Pla86]
MDQTLHESESQGAQARRQAWIKRGVLWWGLPVWIVWCPLMIVAMDWGWDDLPLLAAASLPIWLAGGGAWGLAMSRFIRHRGSATPG